MSRSDDFYHPSGEDPDVMPQMTKEQMKEAARRAMIVMDRDRAAGKIKPLTVPNMWPKDKRRPRLVYSRE
jgi:hypothetical protein